MHLTSLERCSPALERPYRYTDGYTSGSTGGHNGRSQQGHTDDHNDGYSDGPAGGRTCSASLERSPGYSAGYNDGYSDGYSDGYGTCSASLERSPLASSTMSWRAFSRSTMRVCISSRACTAFLLSVSSLSRAFRSSVISLLIGGGRGHTRGCG